MGKAFFVMIRYAFLVDTSLVLLYTLRVTPTSGPTLTATSCQLLYNAATAFQFVGFATVSVFVALRISALWSHNWLLGIILFFLGLFNPFVAIPATGFGFSMVPAPWPMFACVQTVSPQRQSLFFLVCVTVKSRS
ncbi:hypothetical protein C8Q77DRAFT_578004 [Trametes polyzona]|nr:hypothetical protein C8Q77DRAFT_578004 [Trametes polyzona]